jgi:hypothetical protein
MKNHELEEFETDTLSGMVIIELLNGKISASYYIAYEISKAEVLAFEIMHRNVNEPEISASYYVKPVGSVKKITEKSLLIYSLREWVALSSELKNNSAPFWSVVNENFYNLEHN